MDAAQQIDQDFAFFFLKARQQQAFAFQRGDDDPSCVAVPFDVSEIEWLRPSRGSVLMTMRPRSCIKVSVRLTGPLSKPMTWQIRDAVMPGSAASSEMIRHSRTFTPNCF